MTGPTLTPGFGPDGHAELTTLADLDEGLLDDAHAGQLKQHVNNCDQCRHALGRLRTTRALLSALPAETMPDDVARRIDAALETAATTATVVPVTARRRWLSSPAIAGIAAAVAAIGLASALIVSRTGGGGGGDNTKETAGASLPAGPRAAQPANPVKQWQTGTNYTAANIAALVPGIVVGSPAPLPSATAAAPQANSGAKANTAASDSFSQDQLRSPDSLTACAKILNDGTPVQPLAADYAKYDGRPATIVVFPSHDNPKELDVWVVRSVCSSSAVDLVFYRVARPASS